MGGTNPRSGLNEKKLSLYYSLTNTLYNLNYAGTSELFFNTIYLLICFVAKTSPKSTYWLFADKYGYLPTALNLNTLCPYPSIYNMTVPTITLACLGENYILKLLTEFGINTPLEGVIMNYVNLN